MPGPEKATPGRAQGSRPVPPPGAAIGRDRAGGPAAPRAPQLLSAKVRTPRLRGVGRSSWSLPGRSGLGGRTGTPRSRTRSLTPRPSQPPRAVTLPRGAMDAALLHSLLEANCSLALAGELLPDGWGPPPVPEGRRRRAGQGGARSLACAPGAPRAPRCERPAPAATQLSPAPLSRRQVPTPTATRRWTRSGRAGPRAQPEPWWTGRAPSTSTASSTTRPVSAPRLYAAGSAPASRENGLGSGEGPRPGVGGQLRAAAPSHCRR